MTGPSAGRSTSSTDRLQVRSTDSGSTAGIDLAQQLLTGLDLRATTLAVHTAQLLRDAGADRIDDRIETLRADARASGITVAQAAAAFHHAIRRDDAGHTAAVARLRDLARAGDYAYYTDIAHYMADQDPDIPPAARWSDDEQTVRTRWRTLVTDRRASLPQL
ncbi:hypothetical protein ACIQF6_33770 [Kitasatospora sp. NPDC092948]|uniref:hypothetical protein n=1 Tax=Kitasatospora sp. NPDC092948 TaxID=3364088 RepID=UPI0037F9EF55